MELAAATATKGTSLATSEYGEKCYRARNKLYKCIQYKHVTIHSVL